MRKLSVECVLCGAVYDVGEDSVVRALCLECKNDDRNRAFGIVSSSGSGIDGTRFLSTKETCHVLSISRMTLWRLRQRGEIKAYRVNGRPVFSQADVYALVEESPS